MSEVPQITDRAALARNRARAAPEALFLHRAAIDEVQDRLAVVNRTFTSPAVVTPFPALWSSTIPEAKIVADDSHLALEPGAHDLVIHAMALHWANDVVGQVIQCRRALQADGLFLAVTLGGQTLAQLRAVLAHAESTVSGGLSPRVAPMPEIRDLGAILQRSGLNLPVADSVPLTAEYRDMFHLMHDLRAMGETNALTARLRRPTRRAVLLRAAELYAEGFSDDSGRVTASFEIVTLTGWAPDASQQKPLRPGSAAQRLADALNVRETPLED